MPPVTQLPQPRLPSPSGERQWHRPVIARRGVLHGSGLGDYRYVVEQAIALLHWSRRMRAPADARVRKERGRRGYDHAVNREGRESGDPARLPMPALTAEHDLSAAFMRTTIQRLRDRSDPRARPHWARAWEVSAVAPKPSRCRIACSRRTRKSSEETRETVSDRGGGVRSWGERPPARGTLKGKGTAIMKLTTTTQVSVDGVMQGETAGGIRTSTEDSSAADGPDHSSTAGRPQYATD